MKYFIGIITIGIVAAIFFSRSNPNHSVTLNEESYVNKNPNPVASENNKPTLGSNEKSVKPFSSVKPKISKNGIEVPDEWEKILARHETPEQKQISEALGSLKYSKLMRLALVLEDMSDPQYASPEYEEARIDLQAALIEGENEFYNEIGPALHSLKESPELKPQMQKLGFYFSNLARTSPASRAPILGYLRAEIAREPASAPESSQELLREYALESLQSEPEFRQLDMDPAFRK